MHHAKLRYHHKPGRMPCTLATALLVAVHWHYWSLTLMTVYYRTNDMCVCTVHGTSLEIEYLQVYALTG